MRTPLFALAVGLTGCMVEVTTSSRTLLGHEQSGAVTPHSVDETTLEVVRLFEIRRFEMVDQHVDAPNGERVLKFMKGGQAFVTEQRDATWITKDDVGSVFYVWVTPTETGSTVSLLGKPTLAGLEPCTNDGVWLPCTPLNIDKQLSAKYFSGHFEATTAHGILSELALNGYATGPLPASAPKPNAAATAAHEEAARQEACKAHRHEMLLEVGQVKDPATRQALLQRLPTC